MTDIEIRKKLLLGPGPSNPAPRVLAALARPTLGHLDPDFLAIMDETKDQLRAVMRTDNAVTFPVSGTGSAGMEFIKVNFLEPGDKAVVAIHGVFGLRMANLTESMGVETRRVEFEWGQPIDRDQLYAAIDEERPKLVHLVNGETSTGVYQDMAGFGDFIHQRGGLLSMDCVTSLSGMPVEVDQWGVDLAFSGTQKCLGCPPGLSPVTVSSRAVDVFGERKTPVPSFYLNLTELLKYVGTGSGGARSYHHTAPVNMIYALREALALILEEGLESRWKRHQAAAEYLIDQLGQRGFKPLVEASCRLHPLTTVLLPDGLDDAAVRLRLLTEEDIEVGGGLGPLAGKIWRVGLMGENARPEVVDRLVQALDRCV
jgi:alanine-glyoxylate transaminase/serine-glyoxylate transaminase/serine-pyruvate transaminase